MTALSLYQSGNPDFAALLQLWVTERRCPLVFGDWLRENGLESQAKAAEWASWFKDRKQFTGSRTGFLCGPFPSVGIEGYNQTVPAGKWYWFLHEDERYANCLLMSVGMYVDMRCDDAGSSNQALCFASVELALCVFGCVRRRHCC